MEFQVFHDYRRLADEGKATPLVCPDCQTHLITRVDKDDEPVLWCYTEDRNIQPGLDLYDRLRGAVNNEKNRMS